MTGSVTVNDLKNMIGQKFGTSSWFEITQEKIDAFADITEDWQFIHVDPEAARKTPFGGTIAHGFLTLSMLSAMVYEMPVVDGVVMGVNYGFDKIRFLSPVPAGARIRGVFTVQSVDDSKPGEITIVNGVTVEIEGNNKPALIAEWIGRRYFGETT
ncbi:MAG: nodulation protein NodN [Rhodobacterales bacterium]|nr:MAG: nodulation protein NodN [Pseudomonadota bacterium]PIE10649.1 MAG: nodulation protein NodN [Rhodobacterales bacterium]